MKDEILALSKTTGQIGKERQEGTKCMVGSVRTQTSEKTEVIRRLTVEEEGSKT